MKQYLFAYGTLVPHLAPATIRSELEAMEWIGHAFIPGLVYDLGEYPGAIFDTSAKTRVWGQVYNLPDDPTFLTKLDAYEEFDPGNPDGSPFRRERQTATLIAENATSRSLPCWAYAFNQDPGDAQLVESGDFAQVRGLKQRA